MFWKGRKMAFKQIIEEKLNERLKGLKESLNRLKEEIENLKEMVPELPEIEPLAEEIEASIPEPEPPKTEIVEKKVFVSKPALNNRLLYYIEKLEYANNQAEILKDLMEFIKDYAERAFIVIVRENLGKVWNSFGFDSKIMNLSFDITKDPIMRNLTINRSRLILENSVPDFVPEKLNVRRCIISPLLLKGKVAAFLYADSGVNGKLDHYSIDILMKSTSFVLDLLPLRAKRDPLPPTFEEVDIIYPEMKEKLEEKKEEEELFEEAEEVQEFEEESPIERTTPSRPPSFKEEYIDSGQYPTIEAEPVEREEEFYPKEEKVEVAPPPKPIEEEEPIPEDEIKEHESAKRFAKLLVQEIILYHPDEVERGRAEKNLLSLLKDDIEKSREAYEQRYNKPSIQKRDYFHKALVQYLANGDPSALGE